MLSHAIGEISLSISTAIYFIWFAPQLWLNFKRKDTEGLSFWMHGLLFLGYSADLMYGFGLQMQWQYRAVTIFGLVSLSIEHYQFGRYGLHRLSETLNYLAISFLVLLLLGFSLYTLAWTHHTRPFYNLMGLISNVCWFAYMLPQIIRNYANKSTRGLSVWFVVLSIFLSVCDITSAVSLKWDWPSLVGAPLTLLKKSVVLFQVYYYGRRQRARPINPVANRAVPAKSINNNSITPN
jgi:uncharacterized protein with PQ loop repeat